MRTEANHGPEPHQDSPADRAKVATVPRNNRSAVSNGSRIAVGIDLRSASGRRWRDLFQHYMTETAGKREQECRMLASLAVKREALDAAIARGEDVDAMDLVRLCGAISRTLVRLGLTAAADDEPEPDEDGTPQALANLRAQFEAAS